MASRRPPLARLLGRRIARLRSDAGLTQEKLAWESGLESKGYLSRIESGQRLPSLEVVERIARRLHVEPRDLFIFPELDKIAAAMEVLRRAGAAAVERLIDSVRDTARQDDQQADAGVAGPSAEGPGRGRTRKGQRRRSVSRPTGSGAKPRRGRSRAAPHRRPAAPGGRSQLR